MILTLSGSGTALVLLTLSGPGPLYLWGERPFTLALEQLLCTHPQWPWPSFTLALDSPSVALALCISEVRGRLSGSGTAPVLLTLSGPGPLYLRGEGPFTLALEQLLYYSPSVTLALCISGWGAVYFGSGTAPVLLTLSGPVPLYIRGEGPLAGSGTAPVLLTLSGPGPLYLWGERALALALEQRLYYSPSVALALCISGVRGRLLWLWNSACITHPQWTLPSVSLGWEGVCSGSGTAPVLLTLCISGVRGRLLWLWNSSCVTHPQSPWPSVSPGWGAVCSGSGTAPVSGWGSRRSAEVRCRSVKRRACWALIMSRFYGGKQRDITMGPAYNEHLATANK